MEAEDEAYDGHLLGRIESIHGGAEGIDGDGVWVCDQDQLKEREREFDFE
jgi:hypothetical protein